MDCLIINTVYMLHVHLVPVVEAEYRTTRSFICIYVALAFFIAEVGGRCTYNGDIYIYICVAVEVLGVSTRVGHRTCTRAFLHVGHTRSLRGR